MQVLSGEVIHDTDVLLFPAAIERLWQIFQHFDPVGQLSKPANETEQIEVRPEEIASYQTIYLKLRPLFVSLTSHQNAEIVFLSNFRNHDTVKILNTDKMFEVRTAKIPSEYNAADAFLTQSNITGYFGHAVGAFLCV